MFSSACFTTSSSIFTIFYGIRFKKNLIYKFIFIRHRDPKRLHYLPITFQIHKTKNKCSWVVNVTYQGLQKFISGLVLLLLDFRSQLFDQLNRIFRLFFFLLFVGICAINEKVEKNSMFKDCHAES